MKTNGLVQIYVDSEPHGEPLYMAAGDSLEFSLPGTLLCGRVTIAEAKIQRLQESLKNEYIEVVRLLGIIESMTKASNLNEAIGIAYTAGCLRDDEFR